jgi:hypothetical protein
MAFTLDTKARIAPSTNNPVTGNFTCGASAKLLVVTLAYAYGTRTGTPTYNGVALTQADQVRNHSASPEACAELWYLCGPPVGSAYSVSVPNPNALSLEVVISSYNTAAGYSANFHLATGGNNASANPSVTITPTIANCLIVSNVADGHDTFAPSARSGTSLYESDNGTWGSGHQYFIQGAAAAKAMSWTQATEDWGECVAAFFEIRTGESVSKVNVYSVLDVPSGESVSKVNVYSVLDVPSGESVSKVNVYTVLEVPSVRVVKANVYSVLEYQKFNVLKANVYSVLEFQKFYVMKANVYSILEPPDIRVTKALAYTVLGFSSGISVTKAVAYTVLAPEVTGTLLLNPDLKGGFVQRLKGGF